MPSAILGREDWVSQLRSDVERTVSGHGGLLLISGEAGIGKTTLLGAAIEHARSLGAIVAVGTCSASPAAPAFYPWMQILRTVQRIIGTSAFDGYLEDAGLDLADPMRIEQLKPADERTDGRAEREFALFDAIASALSSISHRSPLVIAMEDLHWADRISLDLLDFLARNVWFERILLIATYRDTEVDGSADPVHRRIIELNPSSGTLQVSGLDVAAVAALVQRTSGRPAPAEFVTDLHRRSAGNPFFVEQTARLWASGQDEDTIAPGVVDAVRRRLQRLSAETVHFLRAAAILAVPAPFPLLAAVACADDTAPHRRSGSTALATAMSARLLRARPDGTYEFVHELVRETLLTDLDPDLARQLHAGVVAALADHPEVLLPGQAADHAVRAGDLIEAPRTIDLLMAAGRDANSRLDATAAIDSYARAEQLTTDPDRRLLIQLDLGAEMLFLAQWNKEPADRAVALLEQVLTRAGQPDRDPHVAARVALELSRFNGELTELPVEPLMRASARRLLSEVPSDPAALAEALAEHLTDVARADQDDDTLSSVLTTRHHALWRPGTAAERQKLVAELEVSARRRGDRDLEQFAASMRWVCMVELNDPDYLTQYQAFATLAARYRTPRVSMTSDVDGAILDAFRGRFNQAWQRYNAVADQIPDDDLFSWAVKYLKWVLHVRRGEWAEATQLADALSETEPTQHSILGVLAAEQGDLVAASQYLRDHSGTEASVDHALRHRVLALVAAGTGDPATIAEARAALTPVSGTWSVDLFGMDLGGPVDLYLGMVEGAAGNRDGAVALLNQAIADAERMSTPYWATRCRIELLGIIGPQVPEAAELRDRISAALDDLNAPVLRERAAAVTSTREASTRETAEQPQGLLAATAASEFRRDGAVWHLSWQGRAISLPDAKGLVDLHTLLSNPGLDVASTTLLDPGQDPAALAAARSGGDPILDDTAREQYRARLERIEGLLDEAGANDQHQRRDELLAEHAALISELRAATGLGGRQRRLGDQAERARKTVGARIRDSLRRIDAAHPALADHLRTAVRTGSSNRYEPEEPVRWRLS